MRYVPGYFVLYPDKTVKFNPFTSLVGTKKEVKQYLNLLNGDPTIICHRPHLKAWWGFKPVDQIDVAPLADIPDKLLKNILGPNRFRMENFLGKVVKI